MPVDCIATPKISDCDCTLSTQSTIYNITTPAANGGKVCPSNTINKCSTNDLTICSTKNNKTNI